MFSVYRVNSKRWNISSIRYRERRSEQLVEKSVESQDVQRDVRRISREKDGKPSRSHRRTPWYFTCGTMGGEREECGKGVGGGVVPAVRSVR